MTNNCLTGCGSMHQRVAASLPRRKNFQWQFFRTFSTSASPFISQKIPLFYNSSPLVLNGCLSLSDAPQRSEEWFALRKDKLTTSTFSTALGLWRGKRRYELWHEKVFASDIQLVEVSTNSAMRWGVLNEETAVDRYKSITGRDVSSLGFAVHSEHRFNWLGASPDGLLGVFPGGGILEVKCPFNKGKPELGSPWLTMPFYYMPQLQGLMEILDRDWADLYCWTPNGSTIFRVNRERDYWQLIHGILREFWWENVIPAREALLLGMEKEAYSYEPASTHKQTRLVIYKSIELAGEAKLLCRETAGNVEFSFDIYKVKLIKENRKVVEIEEEEMDIYNTGSSWADQWDPEPLPPATNDKNSKNGSGKGKSLKKKLSLQWVRKLVKKSEKN